MDMPIELKMPTGDLVLMFIDLTASNSAGADSGIIVPIWQCPRMPRSMETQTG
jgi:hypothetical protein